MIGQFGGLSAATPHGSPLGFHSYDPGIMAGSLALWITGYPRGSGKVDIAAGTDLHNPPTDAASAAGSAPADHDTSATASTDAQTM